MLNWSCESFIVRGEKNNNTGSSREIHWKSWDPPYKPSPPPLPFLHPHPPLSLFRCLLPWINPSLHHLSFSLSGETSPVILLIWKYKRWDPSDTVCLHASVCVCVHLCVKERHSGGCIRQMRISFWLTQYFKLHPHPTDNRSLLFVVSLGYCCTLKLKCTIISVSICIRVKVIISISTLVVHITYLIILV